MKTHTDQKRLRWPKHTGSIGLVNTDAKLHNYMQIDQITF